MASTNSSNTATSRWIGIVVALVILLAIVSYQNGYMEATNRPIEENMVPVMQKVIDQNKQAIFDLIHPAGKATAVTVHDVVIDSWKDGKATHKLEDIFRYTVHFTLSWESPAVKNGFTMIKLTILAPNHWMPPQILATNGITK